MNENEEEAKKMDDDGNVKSSHLNNNSVCKHTIHFSLSPVHAHAFVLFADTGNGMNKHGLLKGRKKADSTGVIGTH